MPFFWYQTGSEFPGTITGLATTKKIIQRHGVKIFAISEPGKGASVYFSLDTASEYSGEHGKNNHL